MGSIVDQHYLTPLFNPGSIVVFAGDPDAEPPTPLAGTLRRALLEGGYAGRLYWLDVATTGTLGDLANSRADLALIALPHEQTLAALEIAGRFRCRAALVLSSDMPRGAVRGTAPDRAPPRRQPARDPTAWACSARHSSSTPAGWGRWRPPARWRWCRSRVRSRPPSWTGRASTAWASPRWSRWAPIPRWSCRRCWTTWPRTRRRRASSSTWKASATRGAS